MATIKEVAKKAGVSSASVSHVINNTRFVAKETRERVLAAMVALNYHHNDLAQSLRSGKTHMIGLIIPDSANPFFAEIGKDIEVTAFQLGYSVILCNTEQDAGREEFYVDVLSKKQVDGIIFTATGDQTSALQFLLDKQIPVVLINRDLENVDVDAVLIDDLQGGYLATQHLIDLGHRRIACIAGPSTITPSGDRLTGYQKALASAGIPYDGSLVVRGDYHPGSGYQITSDWLRRSDRPSAIFCANDLMAVGALGAAAQAGIRVPENLSVVGYDDIELASYSTPPLTTIAQPKSKIGSLAARFLTERIADKACPTRRVSLPVELIIRSSTILSSSASN